MTKLPDGPEWVYEIKLDGYRALAINATGKLSLYSRRRKSFNRQYRYVFDALRDLPKNTVVDGDVVALDDAGRPNFNFLQHSKSQAERICYFVFDLLVYQNRDLMQLPLIERREILKSVLKFQSPRVRIAEYFEISVKAMLKSTAEQGLEGVVAKRKDSRYEAGKRSGAWAKYRLNSGQELVIGGYVPGAQGVDSIIVGYYRGSDLVYVARVRNGFVPATRRQVFVRLQPFEIPTCPFVNLPEAEKGRWGTGLTADDMKKCVWVRPDVVARIEYLEWTEGIICVMRNSPACATIRAQRASRRSTRAKPSTYTVRPIKATLTSSEQGAIWAAETLPSSRFPLETAKVPTGDQP